MRHLAVRSLTAIAVVAACACRESRPRLAESSAASGLAAGRADSSQPADVVRRYYAAIDARDFAAAYALWEQDGRASGQSFQEFAGGFDKTAHVHATIGDSVAVEGAAGSQYATVPVTVDATLRQGGEQHFTGTYTVRRAMVDGATPEQRRWHIYSAALRER
jgi:hypothetical protein